LRRSKPQVVAWRQAGRKAEQSTQPPVAASLCRAQTASPVRPRDPRQSHGERGI